MKTLSYAKWLIALVLTFSMVFPGLMAQGQIQGYPVVISLNSVDRVFFASHTNSEVDGNWIKLIGGTTVELPSLNFIYNGPEGIMSYPRDEVTVTINPDYIYDLKYPLLNHQVYEVGQSVTATFLGSPDFKDESVYFMLLKVSSLSEIKDVLDEGFLATIDTLLDSLEYDPYPVQLNSDGDGTHIFDAPAAGDYILVVAKIDFTWPLSDSKVYIYSATAIEVIDDTLSVTATSTVEKGNPVYVTSKLDSLPEGTYTHATAMIQKSTYSLDITLTSEGSVINTAISVNGETMADGSLFTDFFLGTKDQSDLNIDLIQDRLMKAFDTYELSFDYTTDMHTGSMSLPTSSLATGKYVLLVGVWKDFESRIVGVHQKTVWVTEPSEPDPDPDPGPSPYYPPPPSNKLPVADAGLNMKISVGSTLYFSGADSYDKDGSIVSYKWDFDGKIALGMDVSHVYTEPGHYTATLTVKDNLGAVGTDKCEIMVWEWPAPVADKFGQLVPGEQKGFKIDALELANTIVTLNTTKPTTFTVLKYEQNPYPDDPMPENALLIYVDVEASNSTAVEWPIYVEVHYTDEESEELDESLLGIYYWKDGAWQQCSHTGVDTEMNIAWAYMTEMEASGSPILVGIITLPIIPPLPPYLDNLVITPLEVELGEDVTISLDIRNIDSQPINYIVTLQIDELTLLIDVELDAYESKTVSRTITQLTEGTFNVTIDGMTGNFTVKSIQLKPAEFVLSNFSYTFELQVGEPLRIYVDIANIGETPGEATIIIKIDGIIQSDLQSLFQLGPGDSISQVWTTYEYYGPGTHTIELDGFDERFSVTPEPPDYTTWILILILAAGGSGYLLYRRRVPPITD